MHENLVFGADEAHRHAAAAAIIGLGRFRWESSIHKRTRSGTSELFGRLSSAATGDVLDMSFTLGEVESLTPWGLCVGLLSRGIPAIVSVHEPAFSATGNTRPVFS